MEKKNKTFTIEIFLKQVDLVDFYITKNILNIIKNQKKFEFLKSNIFLLSVINKNNKNALILLLEHGKFNIVEDLINLEPNILDYKNANENNLFKTLLGYEYFYKLILFLIESLERDFVIKLLIGKNTSGMNFIDNLIMLLNTNYEYFYTNNKFDFDKKKLLDILLNITKNIYLLDVEKNTLIITKLCKSIIDDKFLLDILETFKINDLDIYPDSNMLTCIDYLVFNGYTNVLIYLLEKVNYIQFINIDDNMIFKLLSSSKINFELKSEILLKILVKSNISKFKNNKNQNIFYWLIGEYDISADIIINFSEQINIYEQDIYGKTLYDIIINKYSKKDIKLIEKCSSNQLWNKNQFEKVCKKINMTKKLVKSDVGIFTSNIVHNMLYTIYILRAYKKNITIPYYLQSNEYKKKQEEFIDMSNNEKDIIGYLKLVFYNFNTWIPHLILWKNKYNYWFDPNLIDSIKQSKTKGINFVYIKLSVYLLDNTNTRHSNVIIIDNSSKVVERFEPYGEMIFTNSFDINQMIRSHIAVPLGYEFVFVQPYPGFQSRSDEFAKYNKTYGDPMGFCLAWSYLYLDIKLELFNLGSKINPIDFINWYIVNKFSKDFNIDDKSNKTNKYILFIRYYARYLDMEKNKLIKEFNLDPSLSYQADMDIDYHNNIIKNINDELEKIIIR